MNFISAIPDVELEDVIPSVMSGDVQVKFPTDDCVQVELRRQYPMSTVAQPKKRIGQLSNRDYNRGAKRKASRTHPSCPRRGPAKIVPIGSTIILPPAILMSSSEADGSPAVNEEPCT